MILNVPGALGQPEPREITAADLAAAFWASSWGRWTSQTAAEPTVGLLTYLTAPSAQGGLQASWRDRPGLHEVRDLIDQTNPGVSDG